MDLTPKTKVNELIKNYDFMLDYLAEYSPEFEKLKNPVMRKTFGRFATLEMAASLAKVPLEKLLADIGEAIREHTGVEVSISEGGGPALDQERIEVLKSIIRDLHDDAPMEELKKRFSELLQDVSPTEIAEMEQQLISEGLPQDQIKRLSDVHVEVFKESLERQEGVDTPPGHPVHTFQYENRALCEVADELAALLEDLGDNPAPEQFEARIGAFTAHLGTLDQIENHYLRKENQLFPFLEKRGVVGPPQVMWAIHDDVRDLLKSARAALEDGNAAGSIEKGRELVRTVLDMIYKEDNILFPMSMQVLEEEDWSEIYRGEEQIGYALITPGTEWSPGEETGPAGTLPRRSGILDALPLDTGLLSLEQINLLLRHLPVDVSFVDENDEVRYYSDVPDRIFPRSPGVIGRKVENCHPQKSVHIVSRIVEAFRAGEKDVAEFWIEMGGRFIHIRYFAVRDVQGNYRGTLEVSQDVTDIRTLEGERRLLDWNQEVIH